MIHLDNHADGVLINVKAHAGGRHNAICGEHDGQLKVSVTQAPEKGKANKAIIDVLCSELVLRKSQVELVSGETSSLKRFLIRDMDAAELGNRIAKLSLS